MLYPSELLARSGRASTLAEGAKRGNVIEHYYSIRYESRALAGILGRQAGHPFARFLISFASFSISSVLRNMATESTCTESVFSTSAFNSLARS